MQDILFSIFMCTRNSKATIQKAIDSVLNQTCTNWELIIVDNGSTDGTWAMIEDMIKKEPRIKGICLEHGVGWAKGASLCLEKAKGKYMTFLAADDFFMGDGSLSAIERCVKIEEEPDIVWVGYTGVQFNGNSYEIQGGSIPNHKKYEDIDKISEIYEIMNHLYYNSFFHFIKIENLRAYGINFFEPFYADYEGVTEAMCRANRSVVLDQAIYALTINTSQTFGRTTFRHNGLQWNSVKTAVCEKGKYHHEKLHYIAMRILNNIVSMMKRICTNGPVTNTEMNIIHKTSLERLQHIEKELEVPEINEMFYYAGRQRYLGDIFESLRVLYEQCIKDGESKENIAQAVKWVDRLVLSFYQVENESLIKRTKFEKESFEYIRQALCKKENIGMFGYELIEEMAPYITEDIQEIWQEIFLAYIDCILKRIYELLFLAIEIKKRGRMEEVLEIAQESMNLLQQIKQYVSEEDLIQVANDIKMIVSIS